MKVNFDTTLLTLDGKVVKSDVDGKKVSATLKSICVNVLMVSNPREKDLGGEEKLKRYELARKINAGGEIEVSAEDVALLKELVGYLYGPLVVGNVYSLFESLRQEKEGGNEVNEKKVSDNLDESK